ncbi:MAG: hypothetical protein Q4B36_05145 [Tissierellia bacterium]|nr:hypothetical protein [Tissierellia bacterium]
MKKFKFVLDKNGVGNLLKSSEIKSVLESYGSNIKNRAGEGYSMNSIVGKTRVNTMVFADTYEAKRDNLKNNTLIKVLR